MATKSTTKSNINKSKDTKKPKHMKPKSKKPQPKTKSYDDLYKKIIDLESKIDKIEKIASL